MSSFGAAYLSLVATPLNIPQYKNVHSFISPFNKHLLNIRMLDAGDATMNKERMPAYRLLRGIYMLGDHRIYPHKHV